MSVYIVIGIVLALAALRAWSFDHARRIGRFDDPIGRVLKGAAASGRAP